jgi:hypothetical protein
MSSAARIILASVALLSLAAACAPTDAAAPTAGARSLWESAGAPTNSIAAECRKAPDACPVERTFARDAYVGSPAARPVSRVPAPAQHAIPSLSERRFVLLRSARRRN